MENLREKLAAKTTQELEQLILEGRAICACCLKSKRGVPCAERCSVPPVYAAAVTELRRRKEN